MLTKLIHEQKEREKKQQAIQFATPAFEDKTDSIGHVGAPKGIGVRG